MDSLEATEHYDIQEDLPSVSDECITENLAVNNITAFTCEQDSAMLENNTSGLQDFGLYGWGQK
jgi:hypothetical protein